MIPTMKLRWHKKYVKVRFGPDVPEFHLQQWWINTTDLNLWPDNGKWTDVPTTTGEDDE